MRGAHRWIVCLAITMITACWLTGCVTTGKAAKDEGLAQNIAYEVADSAKITKVAYFFKDYKGASRLHMEIGIQNISSETKRFRVNIFTPDGASGGGLYPRKVKGDVTGVEAGKEMVQVYPMYYDKLPTGFTIVVRELS
ncbi:MAG: hypothetical protein JEZ11_05920 [Desulfobacterales bacterium]|nr:hypothetical protein [Desulfobacterales bacterium]